MSASRLDLDDASFKLEYIFYAIVGLVLVSVAGGALAAYLMDKPEREEFIRDHPLQASLEHGNVKEDFVEEAVQVFRFEPSRLELLANGESTDGIWDRFEWTRDADGAWSEPRRLMPY